MNTPQNRKLLVIDPDPQVAFSFSRIFRAPQFGVLDAHNLEQAIPLLEREVPDLILVEERLGGHGGIGSIGRLRQRGFEQPIVLMSTTGTPRLVSDAIQAGAFDCVTKPFDLNRIREVVANALGPAGVTKLSRPRVKPQLAESQPAVQFDPAGEPVPNERLEPGAIAGDRVFDLLFEEISRRQPLEPAMDAFDVVERHLIWRALEACEGNQSRASKFLGITRNTLRKRVRKYGFQHSEANDTDDADED